MTELFTPPIQLPQNTQHAHTLSPSIHYYYYNYYSQASTLANVFTTWDSADSSRTVFATPCRTTWRRTVDVPMLFKPNRHQSTPLPHQHRCKLHLKIKLSRSLCERTLRSTLTSRWAPTSYPMDVTVDRENSVGYSRAPRERRLCKDLSLL